MTRSIHLKHLIPLALAFGMITTGCDDDDDGQVVIFAGTPTAGTMVAGETMMGGVEMGGAEVAGTMMVGGTAMAGTMMTGGTEMAGTMMAGGTEMAGTMMTGGTQMAGTTMPVPADCTMATLEMPCNVTIYNARQPAQIPDLTPVTITGVVTAVRINDDGNASHIVLQDPMGGLNSGIWVYLNDNELDALPIFNRGEQIQASGLVNDFFGQRQLQQVFAVSLLGSGQAVTPTVVSPVDVTDNGVNAVDMEGVLVTIQGVTVQNIDPEVGPGDNAPINEFVVNGGLRVDDYLHPFALPMVGDSFTSITGVMRLGNGNYKLIPRDEADIVR